MPGSGNVIAFYKITLPDGTVIEKRCRAFYDNVHRAIREAEGEAMQSLYDYCGQDMRWSKIEFTYENRNNPLSET